MATETKPKLKSPGSNTKETTASNPINPFAMFNLPTFVPPSVPSAQAAGSRVGEQTYTQNPSAAVAESFKTSISETGPTESNGLPAMMPFDPVPPALTSTQIAEAFKPLFSEIQGQVAPAHQAVPPPTPAVATFLSVLAGSLGAQLTKNPAVQESIMKTLADTDARRKAIEDQNYANDLVFNHEKASQRLAAMGQVIETEMQSAIKANDMDRAMKAQQNLEKLRGYLDIQNTAVREGLQAKSALAVEEKKAQIKAGEEAKPLDPKDYIAKRNDIVKSKLSETGGIMGKIGEVISGKKMTKIEEVARIDKEALSSGNPNTAKIAQRNIMQEALRLTGLKMKTNFSREESIKIAKKLKEIWDVAPNEIGFSVGGG